jgi:tetratricopeptide (TPR) repeat protein
VLHLNRSYAEAERALKRALDFEPRHVVAHIILSLNYAKMGRLQDALAIIDRPELQANGALGASYAALGRRDDALKMLARVDLELDPFSASQVYFALGDSDRGFGYLTKAVERRQGPVRWLNVSPLYDHVRSDPRFVSLVARLQLPDPPGSR